MGDDIKKLPHVTDAMAGLMDVVSFEDHNLLAVIINGWRADSPLFKDLKILAGRLPTAEDHHKVIIGKVLSAAKTARYIQIETKIRAALKYELAKQIPLVD